MKLLAVLVTLLSLSVHAEDLDASKFADLVGKQGTGKSTTDGQGVALTSCGVSVDQESFEISGAELYFSMSKMLSDFKLVKGSGTKYETAKFSGSASGGILCGDLVNLTARKDILTLGAGSITLKTEYSCGLNSWISRSHVSVVTCQF